MSLYDIGRPTGAAGGGEYAKQKALDQREQTVRTDKSEAEFYDYLQATEQREKERERKIAQDASLMKQLPTKEEENIAASTLNAEKHRLELERLPAEHKAKIVATQRKIGQDGMDDISRAYETVQNAVASGMSKDQAYRNGYKAIVASAANPKLAKKTLANLGITEQVSEEAFDTMQYFALYGVLNPATARTSYLKRQELELQLKVEQQKAAAKAAGTSDKDVSYPGAKKEDLEFLGQIMSDTVGIFPGLLGEFNEETGKWTGQKAQLIQAISRVSRQAIQFQKMGQTIAPLELELMIADTINAMPEAFLTDESRWVDEGGKWFGDEVSSGKVIRVAQGVFNIMHNRYKTRANANTTMTDLWNTDQESVFARIRNDLPPIPATPARTQPEQATPTTTSTEQPTTPVATAPLAAPPQATGANASNNYGENPNTMARLRAAVVAAQKAIYNLPADEKYVKRGNQSVPTPKFRELKKILDEAKARLIANRGAMPYSHALQRNTSGR